MKIQAYGDTEKPIKKSQKFDPNARLKSALIWGGMAVAVIGIAITFINAPR